MHTVVKSNSKSSFAYHIQYVLHLLPSTHQDDTRRRAKHFVIKASQFLELLFIFVPSSYSGLYALAERKPHLSQSNTGKSQVGGGVQVWKSRSETGPPLGQSNTQATVYSRMLSPHCGCGGDVPSWWKTFGLSWRSWGINHNSNMSQ
jgi:hypothetical protein